MSEKRKDNKGRILRTGEGQRKDLIYYYRYEDFKKNRKTIYDGTLQGLREKEKVIQKAQDKGIDYAAGNVTLVEIMENYEKSRADSIRPTTKKQHRFVINTVKECEFGSKKINDIKASAVRAWLTDLSSSYSWGTVSNIKSLAKLSFNAAFEDDGRNNPFALKLDFLEISPGTRDALDEDQQKLFMSFIAHDEGCRKWFDDFSLLLETGMRVSEFCGLTIDDVDFNEGSIHIRRQLLKKKGGGKYIEFPKTSCGDRYITLTSSTRTVLQRIIRNRHQPENEPCIDGVTNFLMLSASGQPKTSDVVDHEFRVACARYNAAHEGSHLKVTPHVFRHTFCTNMVNAEMDIKSLQYFMGHAKATTTLNVYSHVHYLNAKKSMLAIDQSKTVLFEDIQESNSQQTGIGS